jgi:hypothetical protein
MPAGFVQVNANEIQGTSARSCASPFTVDTSAGDLIVVGTDWATETQPATASLSDTQGNVYESAGGPIDWGGPTGTTVIYRVQIFYAKKIRGGPNTVTATLAIPNGGSPNHCLIYIHEYSGIDPSAPLDQVSSAVGLAAATPSSGARTTLFAPELLFGFGVSGSTLNGSGPNFTARSSFGANVTEDEVVSETGSYAATFAPSDNTWVAALATFKAASAK